MRAINWSICSFIKWRTQKAQIGGLTPEFHSHRHKQHFYDGRRYMSSPKCKPLDLNYDNYTRQWHHLGLAMASLRQHPPIWGANDEGLSPTHAVIKLNVTSQHYMFRFRRVDIFDNPIMRCQKATWTRTNSIWRRSRHKNKSSDHLRVGLPLKNWATKSFTAHYEILSYCLQISCPSPFKLSWELNCTWVTDL